ncbi:MAG: hypothetical protein J7502_12050 [Flavisolibacter sp.]|nr:hypothetical protein [Flavisolibacter sp.]
MTRLLIFFALSFVSICFYSCSTKQTLLIKNITEKYDTLPVKIKINDRIILNDSLHESNVSLDYYEKQFLVNDDSLCVEVELPTLRISKLSCAKTANANFIIVTIDESISPLKESSISKDATLNQNNIVLKLPKISIAFLKEKVDKVQ